MSLLRRVLPVVVLALVGAGCAAQPSTPGSGECVPVKDGVSYAYAWDNSEVSLTLSPINDSGVRCDDVTVSLVGWQQVNYPARWPQRVVEAKEITLAKDSDVPLKVTIPAKCQNDAYWGPAPEVGLINTAGGVPWVETFVNHKLPNGTGKNFAADPMTGGLTANVGPCGPDTQEPTEEPSPTEEPTPSADPTSSPTEDPSETPTEEPTETPTEEPTETPTEEPTETPTEEPTETPTGEPTETPTGEPTPPGEAHPIKLANGPSKSCMIKSDHTLWCWGNKSYQEYDENSPNFTKNSYEYPLQVGTDSDWDSIAIGNDHRCAIKISGSLWCWGSNSNGQLGDGSTTNNLSGPAQVGSDSDWQSVATGMNHTCAIKTDSTIWCWGWNDLGMLGVGAEGDIAIPMQVGSETDWVSISTGWYHTCAIKGDNSLWCWGLNGGTGRLGIGTTESKSAPTRVGVNNDWVSVSVGYEDSCALKSDHTAWCWGWNARGEVGDGTTTNRRTPTQVGNDSDWVSVAASYLVSCGIKSDNTAWCWGDNSVGQIGDGTILGAYGTRVNPTQVAGGHTDWTHVAPGGYSNCGMRSGNTVWCWGQNGGRLGAGTTTYIDPIPLLIAE
ncbi:MAG TPA: hypothetical protein PKM12_00285 [Marmoricola sp.]|nr:hypothetical protein [Marmoricola sp.]